MIRPRFLIWLQILVLALLTIANGQGTSTLKSRSSDAITRASWSTSLESNFGISRQAFHDMGLGALTENQLTQLLSWEDTREQQARKSIPKSTFTCGRPGEPLLGSRPEAYDKVRVYVKASGDPR